MPLLWLQEAVRDQVLGVVKIKSDTHRPDIMTKPPDPARPLKLLDLLALWKPRSRGDWASGVPTGGVAGLHIACFRTERSVERSDSCVRLSCLALPVRSRRFSLGDTHVTGVEGAASAK